MKASNILKNPSFHRLLGLAKPHWKTLTIATLVLIAGSAVNLILPEVLRRLINQGSGNLLVLEPLKIALLLFGIFFLQAIFAYFRSLLFLIVGQRVVAKLRQDLYESIIYREVNFFDDSRTGDLISRLNSDCLLIHDAVSIRISVLVRYSIQVIVGALLMLLLSPSLTLTLLILIPVLVVFSFYLGRKLSKYSERMQKELGTSTVIAEETFSGIRVVKAFLQENNEFNRYKKSILNVLKIGINRAKLSAFFSSFVSFLMNISLVSVIIFGATLVSSASISLGDLTAFMLYGFIVGVSFTFLADAYVQLSQELGASERVFNLLDSRNDLATTLHDLKKPHEKIKLAKEINFEFVSFHYPARENYNALKDISFKIPVNSKTALVGPSGSGKTTIVNLLLKFYSPSAGKILIDGKNLTEIDSFSIRSAIALVPQDPQLFALSIRDNLKYGNQHASDTELEAACETANILEVIKKLPDGFDTQIGDRGIKLSGGEKQRLAIARAILKNPSLLILDEATSALDSENEFLVQTALDKLSQKMTILVIAHRLATVKSSDQVLVLELGKLIQTGTHFELAKQEGLYRSLVQRQELFESSI